MNNFALNVGISNTPKENAVKKPKAPGDDFVQEAKVAEQGVQRETAHRWEKVETKNGKQDIRISHDSDSVTLRSTTVLIGQTAALSSLTPSVSVAAATTSAIAKMKQGLKQKFVKLYEQNYANVFSHNRLIAKVAEWMCGNVLERLASFGSTTSELVAIRDRVRDTLKTQNKVALFQVCYDDNMGKITGAWS